MTTPFDPYQARLASLTTHLKKDQELSDDIENQLRVALTPTERARLQSDYDRLRGDYERHLADWENLRQQMGNTSSPQVQVVETQIQQQSAKLTDLKQQLNAPFASVANTDTPETTAKPILVPPPLEVTEGRKNEPLVEKYLRRLVAETHEIIDTTLSFGKKYCFRNQYIADSTALIHPLSYPN